MPVSPTYPGVYIEEMPSLVCTTTGVPTSIAAFVGWAPRGPDDRPVHITSFADYERTFGGLHPDSPLSYAVYQFYLNGGSEAEIVRLTTEDAVAATADLGDDVVFAAASKGIAGDMLRLQIDHKTKEDPEGKDEEGDYYNLTIRDSKTGARERYLNICINPEKDPAGARRIDNVLAPSWLITWAGEDRFKRPPATEEAEEVEFGGGDDGSPDLVPADYNPDNGQVDKAGIYRLEKVDIFNMLCLPGLNKIEDELLRTGVLGAALNYCVEQRAMLLVDPPDTWDDVSKVAAQQASGSPYLSGEIQNAAIYFPKVLAPDPKAETVRAFPPCGVMAGLWARTDVQRGVWKAPAGTATSLSGVSGLQVPMTDLENGRLNPLGVNCLRSFPVVGPLAWGARTMKGADILADQWKYLPVRRFALFIEESLYRGTQWVVFEPNDEPLWAQIRLNVGAFMNNLFRQGAFQGRTPQEAYLVKCDTENNPQNNIDLGIVTILVGFAPLKPAEFVIIQIQQLAGQIQV